MPSSNPNVLLVEDSDTGVQTAERTSRSNISRGYMLTRPCSQKAANRNRNCNGSKKRGSNVKNGKPGGTSIKELKDKYPLDQSYFEMEEAFFFRLEYKITSNFDFDKNLSEHEQGESEICVKGRLKRCLHFWQEIGANENVLDVIENGYKIPFISTPNGISLTPQWVPRSKNFDADEVSKLIDYDDWYTADHLFSFLDRLWGPHTIDRFANDHNNKLPRFNSLFWTPGCENVNAFSRDWAGENNWLVPPIYLISSTIRHLLTCSAVGTIIVPY